MHRVRNWHFCDIGLGLEGERTRDRVGGRQLMGRVITVDGGHLLAIG